MKIVLENLTKIFPARGKKGGSDVVAVDHFNFTIPDGKLVGLVFQNYALYPHMTALQNILFPLQNLKGKDRLTKEEMNERAMKAARLVQIDRLMERKPAEMSGGQQQRVAIARALVKMPKVRLQTREEIRRIQKETGITTVFVTHDQEEAMSISDLIVVMKAGVVNQIGKPQEVYDDPANQFVAQFLGTPQINMFSGRIGDGGLYIGSEKVMDINCDCGDTEVLVGVRPEGFEVDPEGSLTCTLRNIEVMGRDISIVSKNDACQSELVRTIVNSDIDYGSISGQVRFRLKAHKVYIFRPENGERIRFTER